MKQLAVLATILAALTVMAQQAPVNSPLLDHLAGKWQLQGTVGKRPVTHDFDAEWVLQHHYLRFHEVSREKNDKGEPQYEATVFVGWNDCVCHVCVDFPSDNVGEPFRFASLLTGLARLAFPR